VNIRKVLASQKPELSMAAILCFAR